MITGVLITKEANERPPWDKGTGYLEMYSVPVQELFTDWYDNYPASTECIVDTKIGEGGIIYLTRIRYHQTQRVHQYFSNQLVSTYQDKFKCIAKLKEDGTIE
jgi:hypothetical protein